MSYYIQEGYQRQLVLLDLVEIRRLRQPYLNIVTLSETGLPNIFISLRGRKRWKDGSKEGASLLSNSIRDSPSMVHFRV